MASGKCCDSVGLLERAIKTEKQSDFLYRNKQIQDKAVIRQVASLKYNKRFGYHFEANESITSLKSGFVN